MDGMCQESGDDVGIDSMIMSPEEIRKLGYRIVDMIVTEFSDSRRRPPFPPPPDIEQLEKTFGGPPPAEGMNPDGILDIIKERFIPASGNHNHPYLMANVLTGAVPLAGLVEAIVSALKIRPTTWKNQPASCFVESTVARWLGAMVGFAPDAAGYMTTGGSWANLVGLAVARVYCVGWDVRSEGVSGHAPLVAYISREAHSCFDRAVEMLGIGRERLRKIEVDRNFRIIPDDLDVQIQKDLKAGLKPFCIVGQAGTVNTGAVDDLSALAGIAQRYCLWFHVDGCYGAFAALDPQARSLFHGLERADSLSVDPHKWLNTPFECGCILTKDGAHLEKAFGMTPPYLRPHLGGGLDQYQRGFELSRVDRALKVWVALKQHGTARYARMISNHLALARNLADNIRKAADFEIMSEPVLSVCCFRYVPPEIDRRDSASNRYLDELNRAIMEGLIASGHAYISATELHGRYVLRACIASYQVTQESIEEMIAVVRSTGRKLHANTTGRFPGTPVLSRSHSLMAGDSEVVAQAERLCTAIITAVDRNAPGYQRLMVDVLGVQVSRMWRPDMTSDEQSRGFLLTTWNIDELNALMEEGAWMAVATDGWTGELQGYAMISHIRHLPSGDFIPEEDSPLRNRDELIDPNRFAYAYQFVVRPDRKLHRLHIGTFLFKACADEASRRKMDVINCVVEVPVSNSRSSAFITSKGRKRIGTIHDPNGTRLMPRPLVWACHLTWPMRTSGATAEAVRWIT